MVPPEALHVLVQLAQVHATGMPISAMLTATYVAFREAAVEPLVTQVVHGWRATVPLTAAMPS